MTAPLDEYAARLAARHRAHERWLKLDEQLSYARLAAVAAAVLIAALAFSTRLLSLWWLTAPALAFLALARRHDRVIGARTAAATAIRFYERGVARIEDRWMGGGEPGLRFAAGPDHPYAEDLDLFGPGSLFELLSIARTRAGEDTLASWLGRTAEIAEVRSRQEAVEELRGRLDLREALAVAGSGVRTAVDTAAFVGWATGTPRLTRRWPRLAGAVLSAATLGSVFWWLLGGPTWLLGILIIAEYLFTRAFRQRAAAALDGADVPGLDLLAQLFARVEREATAAARLSSLRTTLGTGADSASAAVRRLERLLVIYDWCRNLLFVPVAGVLLWSVQFASALDGWRRTYGRRVPVWLSAIGELEALSSLATYSYEHPADPFPDLIDGGPARFDGTGLGHPLIPAETMVRNDVRLAGPTRLLVVSGSNMSGKSTLLRAVGVNTVLALAGAPVRAQRLALTYLAVGATLHIQDSLQAGRSRFYAEITRIRDVSAIVERSTPLLFLFDELLQGTNSHDRLVGATGLLRHLLQRGAIGLITTHDLALTAIAATLGEAAMNVHFEDRIEAGALVFDYRMRPGPVARSNGIALMKAIGLEVQDEG